MCMTLLMSIGLTFGVIVASAIIPTFIAQQCFMPKKDNSASKQL